ncbi:hypothetical protein ACQEU5_15630 [Marinactinospora thermotolerans]|uniref:hypothetical protein n=1 Tax=Marinactinospora thermotolerans TaxID=531310 RepID=UPI003D92E9D3
MSALDRLVGQARRTLRTGAAPRPRGRTRPYPRAGRPARRRSPENELRRAVGLLRRFTARRPRRY